ncbi:MAG TPA: hypothetical protein VMK12_18420 [Anaeromyxobacteraceae bacterium]|nr:hypothetical protein [Anaeromyxobacteraceae bacterium]
MTTWEPAPVGNGSDCGHVEDSANNRVFSFAICADYPGVVRVTILPYDQKYPSRTYYLIKGDKREYSSPGSACDRLTQRSMRRAAMVARLITSKALRNATTIAKQIARKFGNAGAGRSSRYEASDKSTLQAVCRACAETIVTEGEGPAGMTVTYGFRDRSSIVDDGVEWQVGPEEV